MNNKNWFVYILECADGTLYTGITDDVARRVSAHGTSKGAKYTRGRGPFILRYVEQCDDHAYALRREYAIKQLSRQKKQMLCYSYQKKED